MRRPSWAELTRVPAVATPRAVALSTGVMFLGGGLLALVSTVLDGGPTTGAGAVRALGASATGIGAALLVVGARLPRWGIHVVLVLAWAMVSQGVLVSGGGLVSYGYALLYLLVVINAFTACTWLGGGAHLLLALVGTVGALSSLPGHRTAVTVVQAGVLALMCLFVGRLVRAAATAEVDALTGLVNRRGLDRHLELAMARAQRLGLPLALAVVDLDHFKEVNDRHGHAVGDQLLRTVADAWSAVVPPEALLARSGGDEFVLVLTPGTTDDAALLLDRLRARLPAGCSGSAGTAAWSPGESASGLTARADSALYLAKRTARGSTCDDADAGALATRRA